MLWFFLTLPVLLQRWFSTCLVCVNTLTPRRKTESGIFQKIRKKTQYLMNTLYIILWRIFPTKRSRKNFVLRLPSVCYPMRSFCFPSLFCAYITNGRTDWKTGHLVIYRGRPSSKVVLRGATSANYYSRRIWKRNLCRCRFAPDKSFSPNVVLTQQRRNWVILRGGAQVYL